MWNERQVNELAAELSPHDLARALLEGLEDNGIEATVENGKALWGNIIETELSEAIKSSIKYSPVFRD